MPPRTQSQPPKHLTSNDKTDRRQKSAPPKSRKQPPHDTPYDESMNKDYWSKQNIQYVRDQLSKRGVRAPTQVKGVKLRKKDYVERMHQWIDSQTASSSRGRSRSI